MPDFTLSTVRRLRVRDLDICLREWGASDAPPLVLLHGIRDNSITFQFLVDELEQDWHIFAPDLRGHGQTGRAGILWQQDLLADCSALLSRLFGDRPVPVLGHSMGGNLALVLAGLRPAQVSKVVSLDALGPPPARASQTPVSELVLHLDLAERRGFRPERRYGSVTQMAERLCAAHPRLSMARALWLARHSHRAEADGSLTWLHDINIPRSLSFLTAERDWIDIFRRIRCPALYLASADTTRHLAQDGDAPILRRMAAIADGRWQRIPETSHNLHYEEPVLIAALLEEFWRE
ncbi:alpha/beta fold hydrolase [Paracoccus denitrificans]|jgi:pimeloyl-ACP methyl ester carboxylesterase|uniref:Alpha/beta hydrolase fold protein n=1 Tax=Paracoccus denitrificans (strain Pd 1222) TaxID=318586 RepID=A1B737_PARDP|nr:alpha/beta hydrolase [Paracoccus denitrificans]ABL71331.1 alpha/beta hydrolase fold protein [Paracoccus denitrificans PD1222]MBB4629952.1 pimeloyl-ACP methyl ester carboxylesterase [Paracoccus denitrificans]MCU7431319.1 alpha/beta hydrolase [Paracoccus denitrificans]QAR27959.1 alpha/beta hydrolase [Paracoccus denitrificans]UPV97674.1 alpha/beta hydrolase [Paracoccus denitrificans]